MEDKLIILQLSQLILEIIMNSDLNNALEIGDEEFLFTLFEPDYGLPEAKEQIAKMIKETIQKLEECRQQYVELCAKLEQLKAGSESLSAIILDST